MEQSIRLPYLISDGMVLQRNSRVKIWGEASPAQELELKFCQESYTTRVLEDGTWEIILHSMPTGGPYEMLISCGERQKVISDILVGDVWVIGGQSNMEIPIRRTLDLFEDEVVKADCSYIRQFYVTHRYDFHGPCGKLFDGSWVSVKPETINDFSAIGYFFANKLYEKYGIPIGLLHTAVGGTPIQAWLCENTILQFQGFNEILTLCKDDAYVNAIKRSELKDSLEWYHELNAKDKGLAAEKVPWYSEILDDHNWKEITLPKNFEGTELEKVSGTVWFRKEFILSETFTDKARLVLGTIIDGDETYLNGELIGSTDYLYPPRRYEVPRGLLKPGKNLLAVRVIITKNVGAFITDMPYFLKIGSEKLPIDGTWKYRIGVRISRQKPVTFFEFKPVGVFNGMIYPLKKYCICGVLWYQGESNTDDPYNYSKLFAALIKDWRNNWNCEALPFLYVQLANYCPWLREPKESRWAVIREEQRKSMSIRNTGMAVAYDTGEYNELHPQDKKTVAHRLALWAMNLVYGDDVVCSGPVYHHKTIEENSIRLHFTHIGSGLMFKGEEPKTFMICGKDGIFVDAMAKIDRDTVIVYSNDIKNPVDVRYAWKDNPKEANLYNAEGLPASPFITKRSSGTSW
jgi:sialate O-acetylesterase